MSARMKKIFVLSLIICVIIITFSQNVLIINATQNGESEVNSSEFFTSDTISVGDNTQEEGVLSEVKEIETISVTEVLDDGYDTVEGIDVEETGLWEGFLLGAGTTPPARPLPTLTGNQRTDVANIANNQVGYVAGSGKLNIYGQEVGTNGSDWCAYFVVWCWKKAGVTDGPRTGSTTQNVKWFQDRGRWHNVQAVSWSFTNSSGVTIECDGTVDGAYVPQVGDYVAIENNGKAGDGPGHTAIVVAVDSSWVYTVEGNVGSPSGVSQYKYSRNGYRLNGVSGSSTYISGFGSINYTVSNNLPIGALDNITGSTGMIRVDGWAYDKDIYSKQLEIHVYVGGPAGTGKCYPIVANTSRPDIHANNPSALVNCGFCTLIPVTERGTQAVYVYAIDGNADGFTFLGNKTVTIENIPFSITYNPSSASMKVGETKTISVDFKGDGIHTLRAVSGNTNVVSHVSWGETDWTNGKSIVTIKALSAGTTNYTIQMLDEDENILYSKSISVTVKQPVTNISLSTSSYTLNVDSVRTLIATISPSDASNKGVTWSSNNTSVVTVNSNGVITAKAVGTAIITATAQDGSGKKATCTVTVKQPVTGVSLNTSSCTLNVGGTKTLTATVSPSNASNKGVNWSSSNTSVATVSSSGVITAKAVGTATITATAADGSGKKATCAVTVKQPVTGVSLNTSSCTLNVGGTKTLTATVAPSNASNKGISWSSSNTGVATVSSSGVITAKAVGTATITATAQDGSGKKATCTVTVKQPVTGVSLNTSSCTLNVGGTKTLTATVSPSNASNKGVSWSSSNTSVATVSSSGMVTARATGTATITATAADGSGKKATCTITVGQPVTDLILDNASSKMYVGRTQKIDLTVLPSNAVNKGVLWSSSNTSVATINSEGLITTKEPGRTTIKVLAADGSGVYVEYDLYVYKYNTQISIKQTEIVMNIGDTVWLDYEISSVLGTEVLWSSSNTNVVTVPQDGRKITAVGEGTAIVTATAQDGSNAKATCKVTVVATESESPDKPEPPQAPATPYKIVNVVSGIHVYWKAVEGVNFYGVWRSESLNGNYELIATPSVVHFTDTKVESGKTYYYKVTSYYKTNNLHSVMSDAIELTYVSTPDITVRMNLAAGVRLTWNEAAGATGYAIYRKAYTGSTWVRVTTIRGNETFTWTDTSVKDNNGSMYKYTIRALAGSDLSTLSGCRSTGRTMVRLTSRTLNSAVVTGTDSIKCTWTTTAQASGYEVRFMVGDTIYRQFTVGNYRTGVKTFKGLASGQTYKVQVRSYRKVDGVGGFYSAWSTPVYVNL